MDRNYAISVQSLEIGYFPRDLGVGGTWSFEVHLQSRQRVIFQNKPLWESNTKIEDKSINVIVDKIIKGHIFRSEVVALEQIVIKSIKWNGFDLNTAVECYQVQAEQDLKSFKDWNSLDKAGKVINAFQAIELVRAQFLTLQDDFRNRLLQEYLEKAKIYDLQDKQKQAPQYYICYESINRVLVQE